ncbi:DNA REPAIR PROTEIN RAD51 HOMOLOG 3 [Ceraceosorus bombacis]|uniref:DNA REPAIR PROTEIN RAD51 HOMOLOG 3 n=1 Tax=Ceraceosorus bombacis TaxID=401625 RepID=A0A0P1BSA8_9BASI|nr:DNA REPAIR PROTEIN RAD51 HOMOLOG 3 [Ceraceosorus bombacis]
MAPGSLLEVTGGPGTGKTALLAAMAVAARLDALRECLLQMSSDGSCGSQRMDWDAVVEKAESVLVMDTEGSLPPSRILQAARSQIAALDAGDDPLLVCCNSTHAVNTLADLHRSGPCATGGQASRMLVKAVLVGVHHSRVPTLASLLAHIHLAFPTRHFESTDEDGDMPPDEHSSHLPARVRLILIDSISYHLRGPQGETAADRSIRSHALSRIAQFAERSRSRGICVVVSNQMTVKLFGNAGEVSNFRNHEATARLVPQVVRPVVRYEHEDDGEGPCEVVATTDEEAAWAFGERGSILGEETSRVTLFRAGPDYQTFAQLTGRAASHATALASASTSSAIKTEAPDGDLNADEATHPRDERMIASWKTWIRFHIDDQGAPHETRWPFPSQHAQSHV